MKHYLKFLLAIVSSAVLSSACNKSNSIINSSMEETTDVAETQPAVQTAVYEAITNNIGGFYKALPANYNANTKKHPLLIFLHGPNETGNGTTELSKVLSGAIPQLLHKKTFPPQFMVNNISYSFIVITPQFKAWPKSADINAVIDYAIKNYSVDASRIYICGASMGGGAAWEYAIDYPTRIAGIVPISGATWVAKSQLKKMATANVAVWAFHNNDDTTIEPVAAITLVENLNTFHITTPAQKTIWHTGGHNAWDKATNPATKVCNGKNIYEWMLGYSSK